MVATNVFIRLHLVDCVVARSATKLGGLGACPHSREATSKSSISTPRGEKTILTFHKDKVNRSEMQ